MTLLLLHRAHFLRLIVFRHLNPYNREHNKGSVNTSAVDFPFRLDSVLVVITFGFISTFIAEQREMVNKVRITIMNSKLHGLMLMLYNLI